MSNKQFGSPYRANITDERVFNLSCQNEQKKRANWTVRYAGNKVRLTVWTGIEGDLDNGRMSLIVELNQWAVFMQLIESVITGPKEPVAKAMVVKTLGPEGWKKGPVPRGELWVGRDVDGAIFLSMKQPKRPTLMFKFTDDQFFNLRKQSGEELTLNEASDIIAKAYVDLNMQTMSALAATEYVSKEDRPAPPGGKSGGYNKQNNQSNSNSGGFSSGGNSGGGFDIDSSSGGLEF